MDKEKLKKEIKCLAVICNKAVEGRKISPKTGLFLFVGITFLKVYTEVKANT